MVTRTSSKVSVSSKPSRLNSSSVGALQPKQALVLPALAALLGALSVMGCAAEVTEDADAPKAEAEQAILNGTTRTNNSRFAVEVHYKDVVHNRSMYCSGHLLNNRWVLTANHCRHEYEAAASQFTVTFRETINGDAQTIAVDEVVSHPTNAALTHLDDEGRQGVDLLLLRLATPAMVGGNPWGVHQGLVPLAGSSAGSYRD